MIILDNAKTFRGERKGKRYTLFTHPKLRAELENKGIEWCFDKARAPWWGDSLKGW